jgi:prepilin-type processing-associated H-X9-DG protein
MTRPANPSRAFSVIEVIVCMVIIVLLVSLMLPALVAGRNAAHRSQCLNNMKQIGLGVLNYESTHRVLPPGVVDLKGPIQNTPDGFHHSWIIQILPNMEQGGLALSIDRNESVYEASNRGVGATRLNALMCPGDRKSSTLAGIGVSSYAACHHDVEAPIDTDNHGVFYLNSRVRLGDVLDGTSTTIFVGEKIIQPGDLGWMSGTRATLRNTGSAINAKVPPALVMSDFYVGGFSSRHAGGAHFCFGDGSVRFLAETIHPDVYRYLGNRDDGEPVPDRPF